MLKTRTRELLMDHPKVLSTLFTAALAWSVYVPDEFTPMGGAYEGP